MNKMLGAIGWWLVNRFDPKPSENVIETWAKDEYRAGVSPGAAARQLCRSLGASNAAPTLKRMIEDMLADANRASFDRYMILEDFARLDPDAGLAAKLRSFDRVNGIDRSEPATSH